MTIFYHQQQRTSSNRCRFLTSALKDAFSNCHTCKPRQSFSAPEEDTPISDLDDEQEVIVSMVRSRAMEAKFRRRNFLRNDSFSSVFHPTLGEVFVRAAAKNKSDNNNDEERDEFLSVKSHFSVSCYSTAADTEAFFSVNTNFSRCTSLNLDAGLDCFLDLQRRSIIQEFCHCEGWPFGLCRKAVLLPPLPKSPSESWSWHKGARTLKAKKISFVL
ncbi:hypothetical protein Ancab_016301 [Ancistrocladus abbreviatus]